MNDIAAWVRQAAEHRDGGTEVIELAPRDPVAFFRQVGPEALRLGFVPVMAGCGCGRDLPDTLMHRHLLVVCGGEDGRRVAIDWVRSLARASPRRHIAVTFGAVMPRRSHEDPIPRAAEGVTARLTRAERWLKRGRSRTAERWLVAAAEAARRRGDPVLAAFVERRVIERLLDADRIQEADVRVRALLGEVPDWSAYAAAAALRADVLIGQEQFDAARAWTTSVVAEAALRGEAIPAAIRARLAELDFWQGRNPRAAALVEFRDPAEAGWRGMSAGCCGNLPRAAVLAARLGDLPESAPNHRFWHRLIRVIMARTAEVSEIARRIDELASPDPAGSPCQSGRRRRLAAVVSAGVLLGQEAPDRAAAWLEAGRGPGPEGTACARLRARAPSGDRAQTGRHVHSSRIDAPGVACLASWSSTMQLVEGLSGLLAVIEDADDEVGVLAGGCKWVCRQTGAPTVAIVSADRATLVVAEGWRRPDLSGEIAAILDGPARDVRLPGQDARAGGFGVSVRYGGVTIGHVVARGPASDRPALQQAAQALAALCGPALRARLDALSVTARARASIPEIVGDSPLVAAVRDAVPRAASAPFPVLIEGESGTGKELVARALHRLGPRRDRRLSAVNCAALTDELVEAELFGHARGAFTGAVAPRAGLFEEAHGGTLFLDEVTELSPRAQAKLLRVLQEREIRRVGENLPRPIDVRIIAACNVPMAEAVGSGRFRDDLRFRLAVVRIRLPALRERLEDVPALARLFWRRAVGEAGTRATLGPDALVRLTRHAWPGNVRELQNVVAGLVVAAPARGRVTARHVDQVLSHVTTAGEMPGVRLEAARRTFERRVVAAALVRHAGRRGAAACELGLTRQGLTKALRRLGLAAEEDAAGVA